MPNPITKRGMLRQREPAPIVYELSRLVFELAGGQYQLVAKRARDMGHTLADETAGRITYCETRQPRAETVEAMYDGLGIISKLFLPDGREYKRLDRADAIREWHREHDRRER